MQRTLRPEPLRLVEFERFAPLVRAIRDIVVAKWQTERAAATGSHLWFIVSGASQDQRARFARILRADVVVIETPVGVCSKRMRERDPSLAGEFDLWDAAIRRWWDEYEPAPSDRSGASVIAHPDTLSHQP